MGQCASHFSSPLEEATSVKSASRTKDITKALISFDRFSGQCFG